ncbi:MAG: hypothetical protein ACK56I_21560, partial [bacterium]
MDLSLIKDPRLPPELNDLSRFKTFDPALFGLRLLLFLQLLFTSVRDLLLRPHLLRSSLHCPSLRRHLANFPKPTHLRSRLHRFPR